MLVVKPGFALHGLIGADGMYALPGDKSLSHRAALFAALADGESRIENFLVSGVTQAMLGALTALGVEWHLEKGSTWQGMTLYVRGRGLSGLQAPGAPINCGNSATTLRLLAGALAAAGLPAILDGSAGLRRRPMNRIVEPLRAMGVPVEASPGGTAPLVFSARPATQLLHGLEYELPVASAQVKSCLLLAALAAGSPVILREPGPSRDHTELMLSSLGLQLESRFEGANHLVHLTPPRQPINWPALNLQLPADISSAAFLVVAALVTPGSEVTIQGIGLNPTRTGLLDALRAMGGEIHIEPRPMQGGEQVGDIRVKSSTLRGGEVSGSLVVRMIDEFPVFAIAAAYAQGTTVVREAEELRYKESDRIGALCQELRRLGVAVRETEDGFVMEGGAPLLGGEVDSHGDHRLAMALTVAGLAAQAPVSVSGDEAIHESFPEFQPILSHLGAHFIRSNPPSLEISPQQFRDIGHQLVDRLADFLQELPTLPVSRGDVLEDVLQALGNRPLPEAARPPGELLQEAVDLLVQHSVFTGHPRHLAYIIGSPAPIGAFADLAAALFDPNLSTWRRAPMASEIENQVIRWIAELVGYPVDCGGLLVSGGNMANFIGFLAARRARIPWNVRTKGLSAGADQDAIRQAVRVYCSDQTHTWIEKAADIFGLGTDSIRFIEGDRRQRIDLEALRAALLDDRRNGDLPLLVVGNAGTTGVGAIDPLHELAALCQEEGLWLHVDGAYGAFAAMLPDAPPELRALGLADSLALDPHKWLYQPLEAGCALVRDRQLLSETFTYRPPYYHFPVQPGQEPVNFYQLGMQNSRGFRALKVWLSLQQAGRTGYQRMLAEDIALAGRLNRLVSRNGELQAFTFNLSIVTFRYVPLDLHATPEAQDSQVETYLDRLNSDLLARLQDSGEAYISNALVNGRFVLRACMVNFRTTPTDIDCLPEIVIRFGRELHTRRGSVSG